MKFHEISGQLPTSPEKSLRGIFFSKMDKILNKKIIREMSKNLILEKNCFCNLGKSKKIVFFVETMICTYEAHLKKHFLPKFPLFLSFFTNFFCYLLLNYEILIFSMSSYYKKIVLHLNSRFGKQISICTHKEHDFSKF